MPVIRAYRVGRTWWHGLTVNLRELVLFTARQAAISNIIRRNGILANPDGVRAVLQMGDEIALVGYRTRTRARSASVMVRKCLIAICDMRIVTEEIVVKNHNAVGRRLAQLKLTDHGCTS
ncbi:hypothetical protein KCP70_20665 [Salmonella enterica subsp. enterica]|nr:hypothetical protein KCP70_20665 [Salmonella enterica subsp. enterica]